MQTVIQDLRYGVRMLWKKPGFSLIAVVTLALGIGVNTALFTGFNIFLRPKPVKDPDTLVKLQYEGVRREDAFSFSDYSYFRDHTLVFSDLIAQQDEKFLLGEKTPGVEPEEVRGSFVSDNYFSTLGGNTRLGHFFTPEENRVPGRDAVVVLSHHFWQRRFAGDSQILGRSVQLNGKAFTVIGVTSPAFVGLTFDMPDIWLPLMMRGTMPTVYFEEISAERRNWFGQDFQWLNLYARLKPGKTSSEGRAEVALMYSQLAGTNPTPERERNVNVTSISEIQGDNGVWGLMAMVLGASGLVLLIACSNIANMLLARSAARRKEIGVRLCLGASRGRLIRQLLTESFLLAALGGTAGVLLAWWSLDLLLAWALTRYGGADASRVTLALDVSPDLRVLGFALLLSLVSGIAFGLAPALRETRSDLMSVVKEEGAGLGGRAARSWLRNGLVVSQVTLCLVLLVPAGLLLRGLERVLATDPGFEASKVISVSYSLELSGYDAARARLFQQQLITRLGSLPGVQAVSLNRTFGGRGAITLLDAGTTRQQFDGAPFEGIPANYFETVGIPMVQGRGFTAEEVNAKAPVVIISESTARNLWPSQSPLGKSLRLENRVRDKNEVVFPVAQVIGVARDNQTYRVGQTPELFFYLPQAQPGEMDTSLLVRTTGDAAVLKQVVRKEAYELEPVLRLYVNTLEERIAQDKSILSTSALSTLTTFLGALALLLATIGIYGVTAWSVAQRTREIGIRMALGAQGRDVLKLVLGQGMKLVLLGIVFGLPASLAVSQVMKSLLFGLPATDPITFTVVLALLMSVALIACYIPARRATKVDPLVALRYE